MTSTKKWLHGLIGGIIGGGANAAVASLGIAGAQAVGAQIAALSLKQVGAVFISGAVISALLYLKQSPLPAEDDAGAPKP
jgi:hypothetical protein